MSAAFVPTFSQRLATDTREGAWHLANAVINAILLITGVIVVAGIVFAEPLLHLFAGDYADVPGKFDLTVTLTRIMMPFLTLVALAAVLMGMLNSLGHPFSSPRCRRRCSTSDDRLALALVPVALGLASRRSW